MGTSQEPVWSFAEYQPFLKCSNIADLGSCVLCSAEGCPTISDKIDTLKDKVKSKIKEKVKENYQNNKTAGCKDFSTIVGEESDLNVACSENEGKLIFLLGF